jgi:hypothetical protein
VPEVLPPDQDDFLLQQLGSRAAGGAATQDLAQTGTEVMNQLGWTLQEYGQSVVRLKEAGWIRAQIQKSGDGSYTMVIPTEVTGPGWFRIKRLRDEEDPFQ